MAWESLIIATPQKETSGLGIVLGRNYVISELRIRHNGADSGQAFIYKYV